MGASRRSGTVRLRLSTRVRTVAQIALFPEGQAPEVPGEAVQVRLKEFELHRPRQWGACWLALDLWEQLQLDAFWQERLPPSRKKTSWLNVLKTLTCYRLIDPGSEWRLHRQWWDRSAMGDLLGEDAALAESHKLYRCLDKLVSTKAALFTHLPGTLENPVQSALRRAALRPHQHLFRMRSAC